MVSALDTGSSSLGSSPGQEKYVVFLGKTFSPPRWCIYLLLTKFEVRAEGKNEGKNEDP